MITLGRTAVTFAAACIALPALLVAQTSLEDRQPLPADVAAFLAAQPRWSASAAVETAFGYKDNLLLAGKDEERSAFARSGVEFLLLRLPHGRLEYSLFTQASGTHYFSGEKIDHDAQAWLQSEVGYRVTDTLKVALPLTGYYYDQMFDVSDESPEQHVAALRVSGAMAAPTLRWAFAPGWWIEGQGVAERKRYDDEVNDSRVGEGSIRLGWKIHERIEARLRGTRRWRGFDERAQFTAPGRELLGTELKIDEQEGEFRLNVVLDRDGRWETSTRVALLRHADNGSGYFNYGEKEIGQDVEWAGEQWLVRFSGTARRLDFDVQIAGRGINPPLRLKDEYSAELQVERKLGPRWTAFGGYSWERSRSNERIASYRVNEGLLGLRWSWEK